ncbi:MAG: acyl-CoA dehydrogenase family protein [Acidimicrobiia bacterium]
MTMDAHELGLIRTSLRHVLDSNRPADVPGALLAEGWAELVDAEPSMAIPLLCEEAGRARSAAPVADLAILWGAGIAADASTAVIIDGLVLAGAERAERFVWLDADGITTVGAGEVTLSPAAGFDTALGLSTASVDERHTGTIGAAATNERAVAAGRRALASQMVGAVDQMLDDTLAYVTVRHQYGRAIGSFQSVKHRLADVKVANTAARAGVRAAWEACDSSDATTLAIAAKCLAGRAHDLASTHCFQVHGGIAFTTEHGFQQWVRRGLLLDLLLGRHEQLTKELGRRLIDAARVPRLPDLRLTV